MLVFAPAAPLNFTNAERIRANIEAAVAAKRPPVKLLVIEASGIIDIDYTGSKILQQAFADLKAKGIAIAIARLSEKRALGPGRPLGPDGSHRRRPRIPVGRGGRAEARDRPTASRPIDRRRD